MKKATLMLSVALIFSGQTTFANVITFDDIPSMERPVVIQDGYGGFNWNNFNVYNHNWAQIRNSESGYYNGVVSGDWVGYNAWANVASIDNGNFTFTGAYLTGVWNDGLNVNVVGKRDGVEIYNTTFVVDTYGPKWCNFDFTDIDNLVFTSFGGTAHPKLPGHGEHFVIDNFTFIQKSVPEPTTLSIISIGLMALWGFAAFKRL
jgi:hypothetical protein